MVMEFSASVGLQLGSCWGARFFGNHGGTVWGRIVDPPPWKTARCNGRLGVVDRPLVIQVMNTDPEAYGNRLILVIKISRLCKVDNLLWRKSGKYLLIRYLWYYNSPRFIVQMFHFSGEPDLPTFGSRTMKQCQHLHDVLTVFFQTCWIYIILDVSGRNDVFFFAFIYSLQL